MVNEGISERTLQLHKDAIVIDMLEYCVPSTKLVDYLRTLKDAGVTAVHTTVPYATDDLPGAIERIAQYLKLMEDREDAKIVYTAADVQNAKKEGKVALIMGMQDSVPFERNLDLIRIFYRLGVRVIQIAYSWQNYLGAGCGEKVDGGLSDSGREAIRELNRLRILVDVAHCGENTTKDAAEVSKAPIAITHATPKAVVDIPRGKSDKVIKAVAEKGGVVGQLILAPYVEKRGMTGVRPTLREYVDMIDYLVSLVGVNHVALGFDLTPFWTQVTYDEFWKKFVSLIYPHKLTSFEERYVEGFDGISDVIKVTQELLRRYSEDETRRILGGNWLRLLGEVIG